MILVSLIFRVCFLELSFLDVLDIISVGIQRPQQLVYKYLPGLCVTGEIKTNLVFSAKK